MREGYTCTKIPGTKPQVGRRSGGVDLQDEGGEGGVVGLSILHSCQDMKAIA